MEEKEEKEKKYDKIHEDLGGDDDPIDSDHELNTYFLKLI